MTIEIRTEWQDIYCRQDMNDESYMNSMEEDEALSLKFLESIN